MVGFLVSAATGAMNSLLGKLGAMLSDEYKMLKDVHHDITFLKDELEAMNAFLLRMSDEEELDGQGKLRVRVLRELSYDIEDNIDKFMLLVDCESGSDIHGFKKIIHRSKNMVVEIKTRHHIAREIQDIKKKIIQVSERHLRYQTDEGITSKHHKGTTIDPRVRAIYKDVSELVGIDGPMKKLVGWLVDGENEPVNQLKVVSIVGFGGLGKTTLANQAYRKIGAKFECRAFVSISRTPNMMKILRSLLSQINNQNYAHTEAGDEQQLIGKIAEFLENKRYFIVIDDIWDVSTWKTLKCAIFILKNSCGSRIITTTRRIDVARSCCPSHSDFVYTMEPLSPFDSKSLFLKRIFGSDKKYPSHLEEASNEILRKCGGLPLAIVAVSSLLATKQTIDQWDKVRRSICHALGDNSDSEGMARILSLSYFDLPHHLRTCLLSVTIFPEDSEIPRMYLIERWITEGFLNGDTRQNLYKLGDSYFYELINRSLIQPSGFCNGGVARCCRVHDTILDFLLSKSTEENFAITINYPDLICLPVKDVKVRRLSLTQSNKQQSDFTLSANQNLSQLRSLTIFGGVNKMPPFSNFSVLRVLDLRYCSGLENHHLKNIGSLSHLRYLTLRGKKITELPTEIGELQCLEKLDLLGTSVNQLPPTTTRLQRLLVLHVNEETKLPDGFGKMQMLEEILWIGVFRYSLEFLEELGKLKNLRKLSIQWDIDRVEGDKGRYKEKLASCLFKLETCNLRWLSFSVHLRNEDDFSSSLLALKGIENLIVTGENISKATKWLGSLLNLQFLVLTVKEINQDDIRILGSIPTLINLQICLDRDQNERDIVITRRHGFQKLDLFLFYSVHTGLIFEAGAMPMLRRLGLRVSTNKSKVGGFYTGIQHLSCLNTVEIYYEGMGLQDVEAAEHALKSMLEKHPNRPTLETTKWYSLRSILIVAESDVSRHILVLDTSVSTTINMDRREYSWETEEDED